VLDPKARAGSSGFALMDDAAEDVILDALRRDLALGIWDKRHGLLRKLETYDSGLRLVDRRAQGMRDDVIRRDAVRVLVLDARGRLLLLNTCDPARPGMEWWELPGGGVEPGEGLEDAARRELYEETGIGADSFEGRLGEVEARFSFNGREYHQRESVFLLRAEEPDVRTTGLDGEVERAAHLGHRWWIPEEAFAAGLRLHPPELARLYAAAKLFRQ
jgi:8-oxo-dGTP pyrophosphatase MutT (NUDIX family)